jgi:hypothetical protein
MADDDNRLTVGFQVRDELVDLGLLLDAKGRHASMRTPKSRASQKMARLPCGTCVLSIDSAREIILLDFGINITTGFDY